MSKPKKASSATSIKPHSATEIYDIFFAPTEPVTEMLLQELVRMGWEEQQIREAQASGLQYNRKRNSFMSNWTKL